MPNTIRNYRSTDLEAIVTLLNAADTFDKTEEGASIAETRDFFSTPGLTPEENVFVAEEDGRIVGYAILRAAKSDTETTFRTWYQVHPIRRGRGLEERLLNRLHARAEERLGECATETVNFDSMVVLPDAARRALFERFALREVRRLWRMVRPLPHDLTEPEFPEGIITRRYRIGEDDAAMHRADTEIFRDHWGHTDEPLEMWQHYVAQPMFRPDLTVIAENLATREIAGYCTIAVNNEENKRLGVKRGWIDILGVRRAYRRQGLGTALLVAGLHALRGAGLIQAALGCDSENVTGATRIYERVGFRVDRTRIIMRKRMRGPRAEAAGVAQHQQSQVASS
ncbi:MAG: GNAT family N-acetyltransferase [Chloroflexi bacterium]|nr:GNAT family N-acetyltransferase [Chloroflexota bacterium]